jgi:serine phosphatase RsbU (regulator of sigma subunit)
VSAPHQSATFTTEFGHEFEAERGLWLRRRFLWYSGVVVVVTLVTGILPSLISLAIGAAGGNLPKGGVPPILLGISAVTVSTALYAWAWFHVRRRPQGAGDVLRLVFWLILTSGVLRLVTALVVLKLMRNLDVTGPGGRDVTVGIGWVLNVFVMHLFACLFLPWTPRECFRPLWPLLALNAVFTLLGGEEWYIKLIWIAASPAVGLPGVFICWYRHSRFRDRFTLNALRTRYSEMKRELVDARRIHEDLFPKPIDTGPIRFQYRYEPMRQIGGDYLYASRAPSAAGQDRALNFIVLDVTGHGIAAALTVNRLHGELDRVLAEEPAIRPGEVLRLLNRYVHLTLATHSVYVTALCVKVDPDADTLEYASGGHPPAFLRAVDGTIEQLDSTSFVLGACAGHDFNPEPCTLRFGPGDALIAYTDGATEARDARGRFLGIAGIQRAVATGRPDRDGGWAGTILHAVDEHRHGPPADDTLIIEVSRPLSEATVPATRTTAVAAR